MNNDLRTILNEWCGYLSGMVNHPMVDMEIKMRVEKQIKEVRTTYLQPQEENVYDIWKRVVKNVSEGKPLDMVDIHRVNNYMEDQKRLKDGAKNPTQGDNAPAVPRRSS